MFRKVKKYLKFVVCYALILSLIAPSYAALSASDGSAFVTKAEFDSALADFNARLTTFEAGINSKIDSQVTSYLDRNGIWNGATQVLEDATMTNPRLAKLLGNAGRTATQIYILDAFEKLEPDSDPTPRELVMKPMDWTKGVKKANAVNPEMPSKNPYGISFSVGKTYDDKFLAVDGVSKSGLMNINVWVRDNIYGARKLDGNSAEFTAQASNSTWWGTSGLMNAWNAEVGTWTWKSGYWNGKRNLSTPNATNSFWDFLSLGKASNTFSSQTPKFESQRTLIVYKNMGETDEEVLSTQNLYAMNADVAEAGAWIVDSSTGYIGPILQNDVSAHLLNIYCFVSKNDKIYLDNRWTLYGRNHNLLKMYFGDDYMDNYERKYIGLWCATQIVDIKVY